MHALSEVAYHKSQNEALRWLRDRPADWETPNLWLLMGPFHSCPTRQRIGTPVDGGALRMLVVVYYVMGTSCYLVITQSGLLWMAVRSRLHALQALRNGDMIVSGYHINGISVDDGALSTACRASIT